MTHWTEDQKQRATFHQMSYQIFAQNGLLVLERPFAKKPWENETYKVVMEDFRASVDLNKTDDIGQAIEAVKLFAASRMERPEHVDAVVTVTVGITRHYQEASFEYGLSAKYHITKDSQIAIAFDELREIIEAQQELTTANRPALMPQSQTTVQTLTMDILCTHIRREFTEGKDKIKLLGGEFTKHGIPVYPEFMEALHINMEKLPMGDTPYNKTVRVQLDQQGKPKRAVAVV